MPSFRPLTAFYTVLSTVLLAAAAAFVVLSWSWPLVGDAPLMHYVVFLIHQGMTPYRQIIDLNLPGTFAIEASVMFLLGKDALAWRVFDLLLLVVIGGAMAYICRPRKAIAALFASVTFALIHGRDGLIQLGQRDLVMAALLVCACALLFAVLRSDSGERAGASLLAGLAMGAACTIKPTAMVLPPLLLALIAGHLHRQGRLWKRHAALAVAGVLLPLLAMGAYLAEQHALIPFFDIMRHLAPYHASTWRLSTRALVLGSVSSVLLPVFCLWLPLFIAGKRWKYVEEQVLLMGFLFGVLSFYVQGRGYPYHRYPSEVFLLLLAATAFTDALGTNTSGDGRSNMAALLCKGCAVGGLVFGTLVIVPRSLDNIAHFDWRHDEFGQSLQADLTSLGGASLNRQVQCMEMAGGCITTLYRMQLAESTGFLYDCYLYPREDQAASHLAERDRYRRAFRQALLAHVPRVIIVSSDECGPPDFKYRKLARWPWIQSFLNDNYAVVRERVPATMESWSGRPALPYGYRIYLLKRP